MEKQILDIEKKLSIVNILKENDGVLIFKNREEIDNNFIIPVELGRKYNKRFAYSDEDIAFILSYCKEEPFPFVLVNGVLDYGRALQVRIVEAPFKFTNRERRLYSVLDSIKKYISENNLAFQ